MRVSDDPKPKPLNQLTMERRSFQQHEQMGREARARARFAQVMGWQQDILRLPALAHVRATELPNSYVVSRLWQSLVLVGNARDPLDRETVMRNDPGFVQRVVRALAEYPEKVMRSLADDLERF